MSKNPCDKCLFKLFSSDETSEGQLLLDVDDFKEGGKETHRKTTEGFYDKYRCGKAVDLMSAGQDGTRFAGGRVVQNPDFRITVLMDEASSVSLKFQKDTCQTPRKQVLGAHERQKSQWWFGLADVNGKTTHGGASFDHSIWVRPTITAKQSEVNAAVKQCHAVPITITIWPIPFAELRWTTFTDSGFDTGERQRHQQRWFVCATNNYFNQERSAPVSALHLAESEAHTKSGESPTCGDLCSKFSSGGDDLDQGIVGLNYPERF